MPEGTFLVCTAFSGATGDAQDGREKEKTFFKWEHVRLGPLDPLDWDLGLSGASPFYRDGNVSRPVFSRLSLQLSSYLLL